MTSGINTASTFNPLSGADVLDAFDVMAEEGVPNDQWESDAAFVDSGIERWSFPRFPGAEHIGTCSDENGDAPAGHEGVHQFREKGKNKCGENFTPDPGNMYLSRSGIGPYDSDVETVAAWLSAPRNLVGMVLALGEPGTGKTALIEAAVTYLGRDLMTVLCTGDHTKDSLFRIFMGEGKGDPVDHAADPNDPDVARAPFSLGPIPYAAKHGMILYLDEAMLLVDSIKSLLYSLADGRRFLPEGNIDGTPMEIHPDFRLVISSNPQVRGASLPEPLASRAASTTITVETSAVFLRDLGIDETVVAAWEALGNMGRWRPAIREMRMADYWLRIDSTQAASAMVPEHCPESQREEVTRTVMNFIGGDLRADGRLVVS